jgi:GNAT superfamily N-acetyltransferase
MPTDAAVRIRRATIRDARTLADLRYEFRSVLRDPVQTKRVFVKRVQPWMARELRARRWCAWLAEVDGEAIGCVWLFRMPKLPNPDGEPEHHGYVSNFYVRSAWRGRGIGSRLMRAVIEQCEAEHVDSVILWPTERSKPLYLRHGFRIAEGMLDKPIGAHWTTAGP